MKYFEITKESPAHEVCQIVWGVNAVWKKAENDLKRLLDCEKLKGLAMNVNRLNVSNVPEHLKDQFCRTLNRGYYPARINSEINKKFLNIVKKHELYYRGAFDISCCLGTAWENGHEIYHLINEKYYIETQRSIALMDGLIEISEPDYLRLRADWLEKREKV